ncbi:MAG: ABC transporter transmembrane domain-containing protein [Spirochaetota bacterium]
MATHTDGPTEGSSEGPIGPSLSPDDLPEQVRSLLESAGIAPDTVEAMVAVDMLPNRTFATCRIVVAGDALLVIDDETIYSRTALDSIDKVQSRDFVGNGLLEVRTTDGRRLELARYSRTHTDAVQELVRAVNRRLGKSESEIEESEQQATKAGATKHEGGTYRCPVCGYPLDHEGDVCPRCAKKRTFVRRIAKYVKPYLPMVIGGSLLSVFVTVANLAPGELVRRLVDGAILVEGLSDAERTGALVEIVAIFLGLIVMRAVTQFLRIKLMGTLGTNIVRALRIDTYRALQRLALSYYDRELTGRIMARVLGDTQMVQGFVVNSLQVALINLLMIVGIGIRLFTAEPMLALIALGPVPVVLLISRYFSKRFRGVFRAVRRKYSSLSGAVAESVTGVRVVKSFAQEDQEFEEFDAKNQEFHEAQISAVNTRARFQPAVLFSMTLGTIVVWFVGGQYVISGALTLGLLIQFITYMNQFYPPIQMLLQLTEVYQQSATAAERVFSIMNKPSELSDHDASVDLENPKGRIVVDNVSFAYQAGERTLRNVSLTVEPGQMIGIVGQTGSGKTTLVSLICRFYDPTQGSISIDGVDLRDIRTQSLRSNTGMVLQDTFLFARTIKENIAYGTPGVTDRQIIEAAKAANAHDFIMNLPDAYDNQVGERGVTLSGGEKQRISIARAILKDPAILILDEATSAVDSATEASIQEAMDRLVTGRTTIAIAHRLSTLRNADKLIVIDKGEIIEEGSHEELMKLGGSYADLVRKQADFAREMIG